tara:strand:+ start:1303 stop:1827 length:525 start_codon:yes stop_codon:yes gene_type:complete
MRMLVVAGLLISVSGTYVGQRSLESSLQTQLTSLFPAADFFSPKEGSPPHFKVYQGDAESEQRVLMGFAFWTTELEPLERGYDGPIKILVGVDIDGVLTGIVVVDHHEPYGYFSIDRPQYAAQFLQKSIRDAFRVGSDIDAISTATLTVTSATRAVRNSARRIAKQFLTPPELR